MRGLKKWITDYKFIKQGIEDLEVLMEFEKSGDAETKEVISHYEILLSRLEDVEFRNMLSEEGDDLSAVLQITAGAGGTESCDWAAMLMRMYMMWGEKQGFKLKELNHQAGDVAGIKTVTLEIEGNYAFGWLKGENGVHRLVRISPFDSNAKRHTSFASVYVYPLVDDTIQIDINPADIQITTARSSGAGGQHVNTTDSAVRITHIPTKIVVQCQNQRSQHKNKETCMNMLKARLYEYEEKKRNQETNNIENLKADIGWGHQIRSYILHPYRLVKDNRTNYENSDPEKVLNGDIDEFLESSLYNKNV